MLLDQWWSVPALSAWAASVFRRIIIHLSIEACLCFYRLSHFPPPLSTLYKHSSFVGWSMELCAYSAFVSSRALCQKDLWLAFACFFVCFCSRTSTGSKQKSTFSSRPLIIPSWSAFTPVSRQKAGESVFLAWAVSFLPFKTLEKCSLKSIHTDLQRLFTGFRKDVHIWESDCDWLRLRLALKYGR